MINRLINRLNNRLFGNPGRQLISFAKWSFWVEALSAVIGGIVLIVSDQSTFTPGVITIIGGIAAAWIVSLYIYAFGRLVDNSSALRKNFCGEIPEETLAAVAKPIKEFKPVRETKPAAQKSDAPASYVSVSSVVSTALSFKTDSGAMEHVSGKLSQMSASDRAKLTPVMHFINSNTSDGFKEALEELAKGLK